MRDEDDDDHRPDGRTMEDLRREVQDELKKDQREDDVLDVSRRAELVGQGGIADANGLGWAGEPPRTSESCSLVSELTGSKEYDKTTARHTRTRGGESAVNRQLCPNHPHLPWRRPR